MIYTLQDALKRVDVFSDTPDLVAALLALAANMPAGDAYYIKESAEHMVGQHDLIRSLAYHLSHGRTVNDIGKTPVRGIQTLTLRSENLLRAAGIEFMEDAQALGFVGLQKLPNVGKKSAKEIMDWKPQ